jgi:hypothetical protein
MHLSCFLDKETGTDSRSRFGGPRGGSGGGGIHAAGRDRGARDASLLEFDTILDTK